LGQVAQHVREIGGADFARSTTARRDRRQTDLFTGGHYRFSDFDT
jgi:hypothetical protein